MMSLRALGNDTLTLHLWAVACCTSVDGAINIAISGHVCGVGRGDVHLPNSGFDGACVCVTRVVIRRSAFFSTEKALSCFVGVQF